MLQSKGSAAGRWRAAALLAAGLGLAGLAALRGVAAGEGPAGSSGLSPCRVTTGKWALPQELWLGDLVTLTLTTTNACPSASLPLHLVINMDASLSMIPNGKLDRAKQATRGFVQRIDFDTSMVGVTSFSDRGYVETELTDSRAKVLGAIAGIDTEGGTDIEGGWREAQKLLQRARGKQTDPNAPEPLEVVVILSDGQPEPPSRNGRSIANKLKSDGVVIFSVCVGADCDTNLMRAFASEPGFFFTVDNPNGMYMAFQRIADQLLQAELRRLTVTDILPDNMRYVPGSARPEPARVAGQTLIWDWRVVPAKGVTMTYQVEPLEAGLWPTNVMALADFEDTERRTGSEPFPLPEVLVKAPPSATPVPSAPPSASPSPSLSATPSPTATRRPSATATPTPSPTVSPSPTPAPLFLPLILRERCDPAAQPLDVVLLVDVSSSMDDPSRPGGLLKRVAAQRALRAFVAQLRSGQDRVALLAFSAEAEVLLPLTADLGEAGRAVDRVPRREGTDIAAGLSAARAQLEGGRRRAEATAAVLLLTDGRPTRGDLSELRAVAALARGDGLSLWAVGLGMDVDGALLTELAGGAERYLEAPEAEALEALYSRLAPVIPCPGGRHDWGEDWP